MPDSQEKVTDFMNHHYVAAFCTVNRKNQPHVVPVFFTYEPGKVYIHTDRDSVKVRHINTNDKVALTVYSGEFGSEAVAIRGTARILDEAALAEKGRVLVRKYDLKLDENGKDSFGIPVYDTSIRCVIEVTVEHLNFW